MTRGPVIAATCAMIAVAGMLGAAWGRIPTETEIMNEYVAHYLFASHPQAQATDCSAVPGTGNIRMIITCIPPDGAKWVFKVGKRGEFIEGIDIEGLQA